MSQTRALLSVVETPPARRYRVVRPFAVDGEWACCVFTAGDVLSTEAWPCATQLLDLEAAGLLAEDDYRLVDLAGPGDPWVDDRWMG